MTDTVFRAYVVIQRISTTKHARNISAYLNVILAHGLFEIHRIKRCYTHNMRIRQVHHRRDVFHDVFREPTPFLLRHPKYRHNGCFGVGITGFDFLNIRKFVSAKNDRLFHWNRMVVIGGRKIENRGVSLKEKQR